MESEDRYGGTALLPDLPDDLVLTHVITRLPWYARPVCRSVSKTWRARIDASIKSPELLVKSRQHLLPLLQGQFLVCTFDYHVFMAENRHEPHESRKTGYRCVQWWESTYQICRQWRESTYQICRQWRESTYQICRQWRKVPSLPGYLPPPPGHVTIMASCGIVYVWSNRKHEGVVLKMDMAGGDWTWNRVSVPYPFNYRAVSFNAKIYVPRVCTKGESEGTVRNAVLVHDMMKEQCGVMKKWNRDTLRVLSTGSSEACVEGAKQELYSFLEHESSSKLKVLIYDACKDSWRTIDRIPLPERQWSDIEDVKLVNGDCFEPAPDGGINIVWEDFEGEELSWFNSSSREGWVRFYYNGFLEGKTLEYLQFMHGQLYGLFIEDKDDSEEENEETQEVDREKQQDPLLFKKSIMKGTMVVKTNTVHWEEVLDIGCFCESYHPNPTVISPIETYTLMA